MASKGNSVTKQEIIQKILSALKSSSADMLSASHGAGWLGQASGLQQQAEEAIQAWMQEDNPEPMKGMVALLETFSILTSLEAERLQKAILEADGRSEGESLL